MIRNSRSIRATGTAKMERSIKYIHNLLSVCGMRRILHFSQLRLHRYVRKIKDHSEFRLMIDLRRLLPKLATRCLKNNG